ncbi:MAG: hypothetical protein LR011_08260, partial [Verrucomicrobia bacterium]|nr:hypothetical protein [Verrucomicrobiota bacterium]
MKRTIKSMLMVAVVVTGGWVSAQQDESSAVAATPEETNALNQKLKEAMARRADEAKKAASELRATSEAVKPAASTNTASRLPTRTVQVGGGSTMNLGKLIQNANASGATGAETPTPTPIGSNPTSAPGNQIIPAQNPQAGANVPNAFGQVSSPNGGPVNASGEELYEMVPNGDAFELVEVLNRYEMISGRQQLRRVSVASDPQIYVNFHDLTAREALDYLEATLALNGISVLPVGEKFFQIIETTEAGRVGDPIQNKSMEEYRRLGSFTQRVVQLKYVPTDVAKQVLEPLASAGNEATAIMEIPTNNLLILKDYEPNVKRMLEMIEKVDVNVPLEVKSELDPPSDTPLADEIAPGAWHTDTERGGLIRRR